MKLSTPREARGYVGNVIVQACHCQMLFLGNYGNSDVPVQLDFGLLCESCCGHLRLLFLREMYFMVVDSGKQKVSNFIGSQKVKKQLKLARVAKSRRNNLGLLQIPLYSRPGAGVVFFRHLGA
jgi:hypothetical protein